MSILHELSGLDYFHAAIQPLEHAHRNPSRLWSVERHKLFRVNRSTAHSNDAIIPTHAVRGV